MVTNHSLLLARPWAFFGGPLRDAFAATGLSGLHHPRFAGNPCCNYYSTSTRAIQLLGWILTYSVGPCQGIAVVCFWIWSRRARRL